MTPAWSPASSGEVVDAVRSALADRSRLEILGRGGRRSFGRPVEADVRLELSKLARVIDYQPEELVVTVEPGIRIIDLEALLAKRRQHLAFEPPDYGPLWARAAGDGSIGGVVMTGAGGPRRLTAGAPRDHVLGVKGVNGFGQTFAAGGRVVKNVTGFDLSKLIAGSFGTLAVVTELALKVLPAPPDQLTLALDGLDEEEAIGVLSRALGSPAAVSAAAHLPADLAPQRQPATLMRIEGFSTSIASRASHLDGLFAHLGSMRRLDGDTSRRLWSRIGGADLFGPNEVVWKICVAPTAAVRLGREIGGRRFYDWGGGVLWIALPPVADAYASRVRAALKAIAGDDGHATLVRAPEATRRAVAPFQPASLPLEGLTRRIKQQFDPQGVLNPGRMYEGV